jgi:DNA-binding beta-propeller fold protein YncE
VTRSLVGRSGRRGSRKVTAAVFIAFAAWLLVVGTVSHAKQAGPGVPATSQARSNYWLFESGQVRPLALSRDGKRLYAVNTPDNRLEVFRTDGDQLSHQASVTVGLEPVAVAERSDGEVWVVNNLSDSVSIVDVSDPASPRLIRTLLVGDEPRDIVFAGPARKRAFITSAHRGQNVPYDPQFTTPGIGRADVWVYDADEIGAGLGGSPLNIISLFTDSPRALAVSRDGNTVYAAGMATGNQTTSVNEFILTQIQQSTGVPIMPPPITNFAGVPQPPTGLIVRYNGSHWVDELNRIWDPFVMFSLPDKDVFVIDAAASTPRLVPGPAGAFAHVGTVLFNMAVNPVNGKVYVSNQEASNEKRFEGPGTFAGHTIRAQHNQQRITVLGDGAVLPRHLNKHIDYSTCCDPSPNAESVLSMAMPLGMEVSKDGRTLYVAAMGSSKVGIYDTEQLEQDTFVPRSEDQVAVSGGGPTGLALSDDGRRLYALTRFDNAISVIDTRQRHEVSHTAMPNPEPASVRVGRRFLYDATLSAKGDSYCGSCHIFGDKDELAWDLGNPDEETLDNPNPIPFKLPIPFLEGLDPDFPSLKGPMTTQSLRGMDNHGPMHWRGDRTGSRGEPNAQPDSGAFNEREAFRQFQAGFVGLLGRSAPLPDADMEAFTDFVLQLTYPPNPIRHLDNSLTPQQQQGRDFFVNSISDAGIVSCEGCHRLDPNGNAEFGVRRPGFFGTDGQSAREVFPQIFKVPHLRNVYTKVGRFGFFNLNPLIETATDPTLEGFMGDQIRGFGNNRGGDLDSVFRFMHATTFSQNFLFGPNPGGLPPGAAGDGLRRAVESFILAFDSNLKPIVGQQVTISRPASAAALARASLLVARAEAGDCDLVAKGATPTGERGYFYTGGGQFLSDKRKEGSLSESALRARYPSLTLTCTPPGSGYRIGIDRDGDGILDGDEIR